MPRRHQSGFTLIELLITVAIIAIVAAISTMAFLTGIQRARQKRTVNDMRQIAQAWEARAADAHTYTVAGYDFPETQISYTDLNSALAPTYTRNLPQYDSWGTRFEYAVGTDREYAVRSAGKDKKFQGPEYEAGETTDADCDIVYANGAFITFPVAVKSNNAATP